MTTIGEMRNQIEELLGKVGQEIRGTHPYAFRSGEWAQITDIEFIQPSPQSVPRWVYVVKYADGVEDKVPVYDSRYGYEFRVTKDA